MPQKKDLTVLGRERDVVVEELAELHHHVREPRVRHVVVRMVLLRDPARRGQEGGPAGLAAAAGRGPAVGVVRGNEAVEGLACSERKPVE